MSTPVWLFLLSVGPCRMALARVRMRVTNSSSIEVWTKNRSAPMQFWPDAPHPALAATCQGL